MPVCNHAVYHCFTHRLFDGEYFILYHSSYFIVFVNILKYTVNIVISFQLLLKRISIDLGLPVMSRLMTNATPI